ncbi:cytochrome c oxidase assembly protein, partial [Bacillus sp. S34]|nr:cytochrome c oxidase assembly protein [Bacillus sp. S34]
ARELIAAVDGTLPADTELHDGLSTATLLGMSDPALLLLGLVVPALLWAAAPVRLIRAAVHPRDDDSTGVREWATVLLDNAAVRYLVQPFPAFVFLAAVWWAFFATDALRWSVSDST